MGPIAARSLAFRYGHDDLGAVSTRGMYSRVINPEQARCRGTLG